MESKIAKSEAENGEYLIESDIVDTDCGDFDVFSVYFRKNGIEEWESVSGAFRTMDEAEKYVSAEIKKAKELYGEDCGYKSVEELTREQLIDLKQKYLIRLADEGCLNEVVYNRPDWDDDECVAGVSYGELAIADELVPDCVIFDEYGDVMFTDEDFCA